MGILDRIFRKQRTLLGNPLKDAAASSSDELVILRGLLDRSLDARTFVESALVFGFESIREGPTGLKLESARGALILGVFESVHPTNIATLVYLDKVSNETTCLVDAGRRQY